MLLSGQFVRGKIDGIQKHFESPDLDHILPSDKLEELAYQDAVGEHPRFFKNEKVLCKTVVTEADNTDGRRGGTINHTILFKWSQGFTVDDAPYIFDLDTFIAEILAGKRKLKMPEMPVLPDSNAGFIDAPKLEWEV